MGGINFAPPGPRDQGENLSDEERQAIERDALGEEDYWSSGWEREDTGPAETSNGSDNAKASLG
jgi:hypothetical protein